jgi:hypothetical protein
MGSALEFAKSEKGNVLKPAAAPKALDFLIKDLLLFFIKR